MSCLFESIHGRYPTNSICGLYSDCEGCSYKELEKSLRYEKEKQTNADRIRAMSDEELAKLFVDIQLYTYKCTLQGKEPKEYPYTETGWREWLKQECEN